ncbi:MAG: exonuclease, partial [Candidatus Bathyarchaeia archaeon]
LKTCEKVLMTSATRDLIESLKGSQHLNCGFIETLDYGKTIHYKDETITLVRSDHIIGAAQVVVEEPDGTRVAYTGDFRIDGTPIVDADVLVTEATYGNPMCKRQSNADIRELFVGLVEKGLKHGPVHIFGYHGKLQEAMQILHNAGIRATKFASEKVFLASQVCLKHGMQLGHLKLMGDPEAEELLKKRAPCIAFCHSYSQYKESVKGFSITLSGWEFNLPIRENAKNTYTVALSDHSDYNGLMEYIRRSKPKLVITDNYRDGHATTFAKEIQKNLGIPAKALPKR